MEINELGFGKFSRNKRPTSKISTVKIHRGKNKTVSGLHFEKRSLVSDVMKFNDSPIIDALIYRGKGPISNSVERITRLANLGWPKLTIYHLRFAVTDNDPAYFTPYTYKIIEKSINHIARCGIN